MRKTIQILLTSEEYNTLKAVKNMTGRDNSECVTDALEVWLKKLIKEARRRGLNPDKLL